MTIETKAREWAEKKWQFFWPAETLPELKETMKRSYLAGAAGAMEWVPVSERYPTKEDADIDGRVLAAYTNENTGLPRVNNLKWYEIKKLKIPFWMPLPPHPEKEQL